VDGAPFYPGLGLEVQSYKHYLPSVVNLRPLIYPVLGLVTSFLKSAFISGSSRILP